MISHVIHNLTFKYFSWIIFCLIAIYYGFWIGYFDANKLNIFFIETSINCAHISLKHLATLMLHFITTFLLVKERLELDNKNRAEDEKNFKNNTELKDITTIKSKPNKVQRTSNRILSVVFIIFFLYLIFSNALWTIGTIIVGMFLGWLLAQSENFEGYLDRAYFPYLVFVLIFFCAYIIGLDKGNKAYKECDFVSIYSKDSIYFSGRLLCYGTNNIIILDNFNKPTYISNSNVQSISVLTEPISQQLK